MKYLAFFLAALTFNAQASAVFLPDAPYCNISPQPIAMPWYPHATTSRLQPVGCESLNGNVYHSIAYPFTPRPVQFAIIHLKYLDVSM